LYLRWRFGKEKELELFWVVIDGSVDIIVC
jgi:hypothetical protein